ncbi:enoyl-CoA hydratase/isomerase family protein [Sedimenticola sp.]|uniref:enoyl-CoA hydratase/isomerase family protein n=1 Tax=Sedimenticola sp. TaxID=1940285 RepID=UPI003D0EEE8A
MLEINRHDAIAILNMKHGPANAMDLEFVRAVGDAFKELDADDCSAVVMTGQGKIFSAGVDLPRLLEGGVEYVRQFLPALDDMIESAFLCRKPVIAALNGHAIAGGCLLACTADRTLMAAGKGRIGVPELRVGVPFPISAMEIMRSKLPANTFETIMTGGATYTPEMALEQGLINEIVDADQLLEKALTVAEDLGSIGREVFAVTKSHARQPARQAMAAAYEQFGDEVNRLWQAESTHAAIRDFVAKTLKK